MKRGVEDFLLKEVVFFFKKQASILHYIRGQRWELNGIFWKEKSGHAKILGIARHNNFWKILDKISPSKFSSFEKVHLAMAPKLDVKWA